MACSVLKWLLLETILVHLSRAGYVLQVELQSFSNPQHRLGNGDCCEGANTEPNCVELCDVAFVFCWKSYSSTSTSIDESACFSRGSTYVYGNTDTINFIPGPLPSKNSQNPLNNPLAIAGDIWPGGMQLFIRAVHDNGSSRLRIDHFRLQESLAPGTTTEFRTYTGVGNKGNVVARFNLSCTENYYQPNCSTYCAPQDSNELGHYECDPDTGKKVCRSGYSVPSTNCTACATASGCSLQNAYCDEPNDCICRVGYSGPMCQQDMDVCGHTRPCLRGTCINVGPNVYKCHCPTNYFGLNCEHYYEDNVSCSDILCGNRGKCISGTENTYNCSCHDGYDGVNCTDDLDMCAHLAPCQNGATCINTGPNAYSCKCTEDYNGSHCDTPTDITSPSESSTAEPTVSESHHSLPTLPVTVGCVMGGLVVISVILCVLLCAMKKDCLPNRRKVHRDADTSNVYTDVQTARSRTVSNTNQQPSSSPDSNQISDPTIELQQQQEFTNPLYSETDHYSSIVNYPQRRDSGTQLSSSQYLIPVELSNSYKQDRNTDKKNFERVPSPCYMVIQDRQASFHSASTPISPNTQTKQSLRSTARSFSGPEDQYSEPADSLKAAKQPPLYHILENGAPESTSIGAATPPEGVPPLYMVLEEPSEPVKVPVSSEYAEAMELSRHPRSNTAQVLSDYEELDT